MALYDRIGHGYADHRQPDPRIAAAIEAALGDANSVVNIGAGTGSYEPLGRTVLAVEPSAVMIRQRSAAAAPCVRGRAESLPLAHAAVDAAMAILTTHHWSDLEAGLRELRRVSRKRAVLVTWVPDAAPFWLTDDYFPEIVAYDRTVFPTEPTLVGLLQRAIGPVRFTPLLIPHDCVDGLLGAYWRRPDAYLRPEVRAGMSSFGRIDATTGLARLGADLASGHWAERNRALSHLEALDLGYRIACCQID